MSAAKISTLVLYVVLAALALTMGGSGIGTWSLYLLVILAIAHAVEVVVFYKVYKDAPGSLGGHILKVFLFGIFHVKEIQQAREG